MERKITPFRLILLLLFLLVIQPGSYAQVIYQHDFGTSAISAHPYTVTPATINADLSGSSWSNSTNAWTSFSGATGQAIALQNSFGTPTITLSFTVATGKQLDITSFDFWRQRSNSGAQAWTLSINGTPVGLGTVPTSGAALGSTPVAVPITGLTGTVNITLALSGATAANGTFRLDNFTLNGTVTQTCTPPVVTTIFPASGPENTLVTITGLGFSNGTGTTAVNFNGQPSTGFTVVSDTQIKAIVPSTATTGPVTIITNNCQAIASNFTVLDSNCPETSLATELFISEIYDVEIGEGGVIEIYNGTANPVNLSAYSITRYADVGDATPTFTANLSGTLAPGAVHLARTTGSICTLTGTPATILTTGFNANDQLRLVKNSVAIDIVNVPNEVGFHMIRNASIITPSTTYTPAQWAISLNDNCANATFGTHIITTTPTHEITAQPLSASVCEGESVTYNLTLTNVTGFAYQWKMLNAAGVWVNITNDDVFSGATTANLTINDTPLEFNSAQFYCEVASTGCTLVSNAVQLTVSPLPLAIITTIHPSCVTTTGSILIIPSIGDGLTYSINGTTYQSGALFTNISPGTYTLYVKSSADCITQIPFTINPVPALPAVAQITVGQPLCGGATGSITIDSPLDLGLTYSIDGTNFQSGTTFAGLAPGTYTVTVMTALGCTSVSATVTINAAPVVPGVAAATPIQPTCTTATGSINITAPLGTGLTYSLNGGAFQSIPSFTNLAPGSYTITVQNADGCTSVTPVAVTINPAPLVPAVASATPTQPTCTVATGTITVNTPVGSAYTYSINGGAYQTSPVFANLAPGSYTITTQATGGCTSVTTPIIINTAPVAPAATTATPVQPTCTTPTGTLTVLTPTGAGLTYSINGGAYQSSVVFAGLAPGSYTITTQNAAGCTSVSAPIAINAAPSAPAVATTAITPATCTLATATITVTAPESGVTYSINGGPFQASPVFSGLAGGSYTITAQNAAGCSSVTPAIVIDPAPTAPGAAVATPAQPTCTTPTGTLTVNTPVGTGITYSINGGAFQTSPVFANLATGTYIITTQNAAGCTSTSATFTIDGVPPVPAVPVIDPTQPDCATSVKGSITVQSPVGTGFTYSIDGGVTWQSATTFNNLNGGTYTVTVQNTAGCTATSAPVTINAGGVAPDVADATPTHPTCTVATGSLTVNSPTGAGLTYSIDGGTTWQAGTTFANLAPGAYQITVMNSSGCTSTSPQVTINNSPVPAAAQTDIFQPTCFNAQGSVTIITPTGSGYTYSIDGTNFQNGLTFINLNPGNYNITVQNLQGCTSVTPITINAAPLQPTAPIVQVTPPSCDTPTGVITVTSPTGTGYTYSLDGTTWQDGTQFSGLVAGSYDITVRNADGCTATAANIDIDNVTGSIQVAAAEGCEPTTFGNHYVLHIMPDNGSFNPDAVTYTWTNENGVVVGSESSFDATEYARNFDIDASDYPLEFMVTVSTPGGCIGNTVFSVSGTFCDIPKGISPNDDNKNDNFDISGMNASKVSIFNRFGQEVYSRNDYTNQWYGQSNSNDELPTGTYYYVVVLPTETRTGWVYINRQE